MSGEPGDLSCTAHGVGVGVGVGGWAELRKGCGWTGPGLLKGL